MELPDWVLIPRSLVIAKEEDAVVQDRSACGAAKLVLVEGRPGQSGTIGEEVVGVKNIVAHKFKDCTVELIGSGLEGC